MSDVETPSGPAVFPWEGGRCCQQLQLGAPLGGGGVVSKGTVLSRSHPSSQKRWVNFPLAGSVPVSYLVPSVFLPSFPCSFPESWPDFEQEAYFSDALREAPGKAQTFMGSAGLRNQGCGGQPGLGVIGARWAGSRGPPGPQSSPTPTGMHHQQEGEPAWGGITGKLGYWNSRTHLCLSVAMPWASLWQPLKEKSDFHI